MAKPRRTTPEDFPELASEGNTMVGRALEKAKLQAISGSAAPGGKMAQRRKPTRPTKPSTRVETSEPKELLETERGQSISSTLLKGAALVPESSISGAVRGLLGGASVGLDVGTALSRYKQKKREATAANAAMQMDTSPVQPPTPSNVPDNAGANALPTDALGSYYGKAAGPQIRRARSKRRALLGPNYTESRNV